MPFDAALAERVHDLMIGREGALEKRMFGGICFMLRGNMCCGVVRDRLMLRLGPDGAAEALEHPHTEPMDFTGKPMKSMVYVVAAGYTDDADLERWIETAVRFVTTLPAK
jgi:TfoX/Sxy family transcriptional regulator of competence genes